MGGLTAQSGDQRGQAGGHAQSAVQDLLAEREGFEPPEPCGSAVFKTAAIDHSATSPYRSIPCAALCLATFRLRFGDEL
jgi:hypothetical protein